MQIRKKLLASAILCCAPMVASGAIVFSDDFGVDDNASWNKNIAPSGATVATQQSAEFAFDYSTFGIPAAPGSADTKGLRLRANIPGSAAAPLTSRPTQTLSGISVSPTGKNFGTNYQVTFYAWSNFNGTAANNTGLADNGTSEGGTNNVMMAVGTSGAAPLVVGNTGLVTNGQMDGIGFATTGDGGITNDYRVYPKSGTIAAANATTAAGAVYAAGSNANTATYYQTLFGTHTAPAIQLTLSTAEYGS